ncbi:hypothetical protein [Thioalkalivibrio sp. ALgr3]|uniref:hypothetical protein n=1 Tax=Thioalkalivibrio sp. ALgr3 TaxID=1239292 RepID=UPI0003651E65|nr:hypothetical protein [Thioalkalivibrio sp. ALgr3]
MAMDEWHYELAAKREQEERDRQIAACREEARGPAPQWDGDRALCVACGEDNTERAQAGRARCLDCQEIFESRRARGLV